MAPSGSRWADSFLQSSETWRENIYFEKTVSQIDVEVFLPNEGKLLLIQEDGNLLNLPAWSYDLLHNLERKHRIKFTFSVSSQSVLYV